MSHLATVLVSEGNPTQDCFKKMKGSIHSIKRKGGGIGRVKKNNSPEHTVITRSGLPMPYLHTEL